MSMLPIRAARRAAAALVVLVVVGGLVLAQTLPAGVRTGPTVAGITEYTFPNGLRVLLVPDSGSGRIAVNMTYLVGSRHEGNGETGMAHLLEHMLFLKSAKDRDIKKELTDRGTTWNGSTYYDRTNYYETFNASEENLRWALGLEAERMVNMRIEKALLDTEMTVVRNEFERGENSVAGVLEERVFSSAYLWHNYGKSTIGSRADLERVPVDRLAAFYRMYYQPDNAVLVIGGAIDPAKTLAMVASAFGSLRRPTRKLPETYTVEPPQDGERNVELRRVGRGQNLIVGYHGPAMAHPDAAALEVLAQVLTGGGIGRLDKALVDAKKALSLNFSVGEFHDPGLIVVSSTLSDDQSVSDVKQIIYDELQKLAAERATEEELFRARNRITQGMERNLANPLQFVVNALTEVIAAGDWRLWFTNYEEIKRVTADDVMRVAKTYFKASNRTVGVFTPEKTAPDRTIVPEAPTMDVLLKTYPPELRVSAGEALDPAPAALEKRVDRSTIGGGLRLALVPKASRGDRVQATLTLRFGDERSLAGKEAAAGLTETLLTRGTRSKSRQQLQDEMQRLSATISFGGGTGAVTASISTTGPNLPAALRLAAEMLREPSLPEADFDQIRRQRIATVDRNRTDPATLVNLRSQQHLSPYPRGDVRHVRSIDEEIEDLNTLSLNDVRQFHSAFYGASQGELVVVGKFDSAVIQQTASELFTSWRSASPYTRIVTAYRPVARVDVKIETPDKENAQFSAGFRLQMKDTDPDYAAMVMANYMFGGTITGRFPNRVRNREGYSYGASSSFTAPVQGDAATFSVAAIANPTNTPKVEASFLDELTKTLATGFTAAELAAAKQSIKDSRVGARSSDAGLLSLLAAREQWGRSLAWDASLDTKLQALTLEQVNAAFRRHVRVGDAVIVKGGDFARFNAY